MWNALDHLQTATRTGANAIAESYAYDDSGRRIQKVSGATTTSYLYDGDDIHAEWSGSISGNPAAAYVHGAGIDEPLLRLTGTTNITGTLTANQRFDAWGNKTTSSGTIPQYGYTGREPDENIALMNNLAPIDKPPRSSGFFPGVKGGTAGTMQAPRVFDPVHFQANPLSYDYNSVSNARSENQADYQQLQGLIYGNSLLNTSGASRQSLGSMTTGTSPSLYSGGTTTGLRPGK